MYKWARFVKNGEPYDGLGLDIKIDVKSIPVIPGFHLSHIAEHGIVNRVRVGE